MPRIKLPKVKVKAKSSTSAVKGAQQNASNASKIINAQQVINPPIYQRVNVNGVFSAGIGSTMPNFKAYYSKYLNNNAQLNTKINLPNIQINQHQFIKQPFINRIFNALSFGNKKDNINIQGDSPNINFKRNPIRLFDDWYSVKYRNAFKWIYNNLIKSTTWAKNGEYIYRYAPLLSVEESGRGVPIHAFLIDYFKELKNKKLTDKQILSGDNSNIFFAIQDIRDGKDFTYSNQFLDNALTHNAIANQTKNYLVFSNDIGRIGKSAKEELREYAKKNIKNILFNSSIRKKIDDITEQIITPKAQIGSLEDINKLSNLNYPSAIKGLLRRYPNFVNKYKTNINNDNGRLLITLDGSTVSFHERPTGKITRHNISGNKTELHVEDVMSSNISMTLAGDIIRKSEMAQSRKYNDILKWSREWRSFLENRFGGKAFGSILYPELGDEIGIVGKDVDMLFTESQIRELAKTDKQFKDILDEIEKGHSGVGLKYDLAEGPDGQRFEQIPLEQRQIDVNVIKEDENGNAISSKIADEIYRQFYPNLRNNAYIDTWIENNANRMSGKGVNMQKMNIVDKFGNPILAKDLFDSFDPVEKTFLDVMESSKSKHVGRSMAILFLGDSKKIAQCLDKYEDMLFGASHDHIPQLLFKDAKKNSKVLYEMNIPDNLHFLFINNADKMQNLVRYWTLNKILTWRGLSQRLDQPPLTYETINSAMNKRSGLGGEAYGKGLYSTEGDNGDIVSSSHLYDIWSTFAIPIKDIKTNDPIEWINGIKKHVGDASYTFTPNELQKIKEVLPKDLQESFDRDYIQKYKNNFTINQLAGLWANLSMNLSDKEVENFQNVLKSFGIYAFSGHTTYNSRSTPLRLFFNDVAGTNSIFYPGDMKFVNLPKRLQTISVREGLAKDNLHQEILDGRQEQTDRLAFSDYIHDLLLNNDHSIATKHYMPQINTYARLANFPEESLQSRYNKNIQAKKDYIENVAKIVKNPLYVSPQEAYGYFDASANGVGKYIVTGIVGGIGALGGYGLKKLYDVGKGIYDSYNNPEEDETEEVIQTPSGIEDKVTLYQPSYEEAMTNTPIIPRISFEIPLRLNNNGRIK